MDGPRKTRTTLRKWPLRAACLVGLLGIPVRDAAAHRAPRADAWWVGLDAPATSAPPRDVVVLKQAPRGRVRIPGGTFVMGSSQA